jgi:hypothetical protein
MKSTSIGTVRRILAGTTNRSWHPILVVALGLGAAGVMAQEVSRGGGQAKGEGPSRPGPAFAAGSLGTTNVQAPEPEDTNSPVNQIREQLRAVKAKVDDAVKIAAAALNSTPEKQEANVRALAGQLRGFAKSDVGSDSEICKHADLLIKAMQQDILDGEKQAADGKLKSRAARESLVQTVRDVRVDLEVLRDTRASADKTRAKLLAQADELEDEAVAIAFAEHCIQHQHAAKAYEAAMQSVEKFADDLALIVGSVARPTAARID